MRPVVGMMSTKPLSSALARTPWFGLPILALLTFPGRDLPQQADGWIFGSFCLIWVVMFIVWIFLAIWTYRDAESRGMNGALWLIVVLIAGIIGIIVYLVVRSDKPAYPQGGYYQQPGYYQQQPGYYPQQQQGYYQQPQYPPAEGYPPQEQPRQYDPETGQYK